MSDNIRYYYFNVGGGIITAYTVRNPITAMVNLGFAFCSPKDTFNKERGRLIATGRALKRPCAVPYTGSTRDDAARFIDLNTKLFPSWVQKNWGK